MTRQLILRHMKLFYRDKATVFFSILSALILLGLYQVFLGDMLEKNLTAFGFSQAEAKQLMAAWLVAGLIVINAFTIPLSMIAGYVEDQEKKISYDFYTSPASRFKLLISYLIASLIMGILLVFLSVLAGQVFILIRGGDRLSLSQALRQAFALLVMIFSFLSFDLVVISFIKSLKTLSIFQTITGTVIGFAAGIYIPLKNLSEGLQVLLSYLPVTQGAVLIRNLYLSPILESLALRPEQEEALRSGLGLQMTGKGLLLDDQQMLLYIFIFGVVCLCIAGFRLSKKAF